MANAAAVMDKSVVEKGGAVFAQRHNEEASWFAGDWLQGEKRHLAVEQSGSLTSQYQWQWHFRRRRRPPPRHHHLRSPPQRCLRCSRTL
jgi:hypothetical protein